MVSAKIIINHLSGLHARPAFLLAQEAKKYNSNIRIMVEEKSVDAKNVLQIIEASIKEGEEVEILCKGKTEVEDLKRLIFFIENNLREG